MFCTKEGIYKIIWLNWIQMVNKLFFSSIYILTPKTCSSNLSLRNLWKLVTNTQSKVCVQKYYIQLATNILYKGKDLWNNLLYLCLDIFLKLYMKNLPKNCENLKPINIQSKVYIRNALFYQVLLFCTKKWFIKNS
jgi:hypothetical protein